MESIAEEFGIIDSFLYELIPENHVSSTKLIEDFILGKWVIEPGIVIGYLKEILLGSIGEIKQLFVTMIIVFALSAIITAVMQAFSGTGLEKATKMFFVLCELVVLIGALNNVIVIYSGAMYKILDFIKLTIPAYMICIATAGAGLTAAIFYKLLLGFVCMIEGIIISAITPLIEGYIIFGIIESLFGEERFKQIMSDIKRLVIYILRGLIMIISTSGVMQIIVTPAIDKANISVAQKAASAIPIIGDIAESISGVTIISALTLKNSVGALILVVLCLCLLAPVVKIACILGALRLATAIGGISGEMCMINCADYMTDAGFLFLRVLITIGALFFVTIAALTCIT